MINTQSLPVPLGCVLHNNYLVSPRRRTRVNNDLLKRFSIFFSIKSLYSFPICHDSRLTLRWQIREKRIYQPKQLRESTYMGFVCEIIRSGLSFPYSLWRDLCYLWTYLPSIRSLHKPFKTFQVTYLWWLLFYSNSTTQKPQSEY